MIGLLSSQEIKLSQALWLTPEIVSTWNTEIGRITVLDYVVGKIMDQREQDSNPDGWRKGRFMYASVPHLDLSKMAPDLVGFLCLRMWKQASRKDKSRCGS
jgi:hypothetical protein